MLGGLVLGALLTVVLGAAAVLIARRGAPRDRAGLNTFAPDPSALESIRQTELLLGTRHAEIQSEQLELQSERVRLQAERSELQSERSELQSERSELQSEREKLQAEREKLQEDRGKLYRSAEEQVASIQAERELIKDEREKLQEDRGKLYRSAEEQLAEIRRQASQREEELGRAEERIDRLQEGFEARNQSIARQEREIAEHVAVIEDKRRQWDEAHRKRLRALEQVAAMTTAEARQQVVSEVREEAKRESMQFVRELTEKAKVDAERRARRIVSLAIQRIASDTVAEATISVVEIPSEEMKGRLIGKEGRNIRSFEAVTGVNLIIDDTPDAVLLSSFDPVRREMARLTLAALIEDGRIHPARIEEIFTASADAVETEAKRAGEEAMLDIGISTMHPELVRALGHLKFRTSYGQNVLAHLRESAHIAGMMASELGIEPSTVMRGTLLHDVGKSLTHKVSGSHALIGADLARRLGETPAVCHIIESHHGEVEQQTVEAVLGQSADQLSGARPGARREDVARHIAQLEQLEKICLSHNGVEKAFAMRAGHDVRVIVDPSGLDDIGAQVVARDIAKEIENELDFPGQIRVTVIRESRAVEYAK